MDREARGNLYDQAVDSVLEFEKRHGHRAAWRQLSEFMIEYLSSMSGTLPAKAQKAFAVAVKVANLDGMNEEIEHTRASCCHYLSSVDFRYDFENRENCAVRAVLCVLQAESPSIDLADTCLWFLSFADKVEDRSEVIEDLVGEHFPNDK